MPLKVTFEWVTDINPSILPRGLDAEGGSGETSGILPVSLGCSGRS